MRNTSTGIAGLVMVILALSWWTSCAGICVYGIYLAFSASLVLGICCLFAPFLFPLFGLLQMFAHFNLPLKILEFFSK